MEGRGIETTILSATGRHTSALTASLPKTANSLLVATQELCLCKEVWNSATFLEK
jgi:hypothetical protein